MESGLEERQGYGAPGTLLSRQSQGCQSLTDLSVTQTRELLDCLSLFHAAIDEVDIATTLLHSIGLILTETQSAQTAKIEFAQSPTNAAAVLAACLRTLCLVRTDNAVSSEQVIEMVQKFGWHRQVLASLADLSGPTE